MERSLLSHATFVGASKDFVCVRLNAHEDEENHQVAGKFGDRNMPVHLYIVDSAGERVFLDIVQLVKGKDIKGFFADPECPSLVAGEMAKIARKHPGKREPRGRAGVPWMKTLREALTQGNCDGKPILLHVSDRSAGSRKLEDLVGDASVQSRFGTEFLFVQVPKDSEEVSKYTLPAPPSLSFAAPKQLGKDVELLTTPADRSALGKSMEKAISEFGRTFKRDPRK